MNITTTTGAVVCECPEPSKTETAMVCSRHDCTKSHAMWVKCQVDESWWKAWEAGRGPRQVRFGQTTTQRAVAARPKPLTPEEATTAAERLTDETGDPTIGEKLAHYRKALTAWVRAGFPSRTDEEVATIHADHCVPCKKYDADQKVCTKCGCGVSKTGMAAFNKLRMATESCPMGKWGEDHSTNGRPDES